LPQAVCWTQAAGAAYSPARKSPLEPSETALSSFLKTVFTWWNGATAGIRFTVARRGVFVGQDDYGNRYYEAKDAYDSYDGRKRRWVIYNGYAEASKVPAEWHGWLHHTFIEPPTSAPLPRKRWEKDHRPNLSGTIHAYRPKGAISRGGERQRATGDYEAWTPE
jgi:NADH:ubiquinone oxidoreductase subunit